MYKSRTQFTVPLLFILYHSTGNQKRKIILWTGFGFFFFSKTCSTYVLPAQWINLCSPNYILSPNLKTDSPFIRIFVKTVFTTDRSSETLTPGETDSVRNENSQTFKQRRSRGTTLSGSILFCLLVFEILIYSRTSMARTPLGP